jgi:hypothetical protein
MASSPSSPTLLFAVAVLLLGCFTLCSAVLTVDPINGVDLPRLVNQTQCSGCGQACASLPCAIAVAYSFPRASSNRTIQLVAGLHHIVNHTFITLEDDLLIVYCP